MFRYIKLYFSYIKQSIIGRLEFKADLFISVFAFFLASASSLGTIYLTISSVPSLIDSNGISWTFWEIGLIYGFSLIPIGLDHLFTDELWRVAYFRVANGTVDRYFLRPLPILFQVIAERFQFDAFGELIVGIFLIVICSLNTSVCWNFQAIFLLIVASIFGAIIISSLKIIFSSLAFRFKKSGPLLQIVYNFRDYSRYPINIFPKALQFILCFAFPFGLFSSLPFEAILKGTYNCYYLSLIIAGVSILFLSLSMFIWIINIRKYESTGS